MKEKQRSYGTVKKSYPVTTIPKFHWLGVEFTAHSKPMIVLFWFITISLTLFFVGSFATKVYSSIRTPPLPPPSICVLLPDPASFSDGAFYQDGVVQKRGFTKAEDDADKLSNRLRVQYIYMRREVSADTLLNQMKMEYAQSGATYFVMTMSSKIEAIRSHFINWHNDCVQMGVREPILIATVASAPDLADGSGGILRWYVRSQEESAALAEYLSWKEGIMNAGVFFITRHVGQTDDEYGKGGMETFRERFINGLGGKMVDPYCTTAGTAKSNVSEFLAKVKRARLNSNNTGVFIVGYGDMVREVLNELLKQGFTGPIACASTLTEPDWQPKERSADNRIVTVLPRLANPQTRLEVDDRNVVFFFAKEALFRVLELTATDANSKTFVERWKTESKKYLNQEFLANGDCAVQLNVVGSEEWRWIEH